MRPITRRDGPFSRRLPRCGQRDDPIDRRPHATERSPHARGLRGATRPIRQTARGKGEPTRPSGTTLVKMERGTVHTAPLGYMKLARDRGRALEQPAPSPLLPRSLVEDEEPSGGRSGKDSGAFDPLAMIRETTCEGGDLKAGGTEDAARQRGTATAEPPAGPLPVTPNPSDARSRTEARTNAIDPSPPLTVDVLRRKLDAAIVAEAWDAVKAIRERMVEVERGEAGNVVSLSPRKRVER